MYRIFRKVSDSNESSRSKRSSSATSDASKATARHRTDSNESSRSKRSSSATSDASKATVRHSPREKKYPHINPDRDNLSDRISADLFKSFMKGRPPMTHYKRPLRKKEKIDKLLRELEAQQRKVVSDSNTLSMRIEQNLDELSRIRESLKKNTDALASLTHDCKKV